MKLSIISINYKKPQQAIACMASLWKFYKNEFEAGLFEYIVVDNLSEDNSLQILKEAMKQYKNVQVVANDKNGGFGNGNNVGEMHAKGSYILFLNDDIVVEDRGLVKMLEYLEQHAEVGALGGRLLNSDGSEQSASGQFYTTVSISLFILGFQRVGLIDKNPTKLQTVDWVKGALLMMPKAVFEKIGRFDEKIWMYTEDMEICYRVHLAGLKCVYFPDVKIRHKEHGSGNRTFAIVNIYKNLPYFYKKHKSVGEYLYVKFLLRFKAMVLIVLGKVSGNKYLTDTYSQALAAVK